MPTFKLLCVDDDRTIDLPVGHELSVGRAVSSDVVVAESTVSREHARLKVSGEQVEIVDLDSRNGTFVNDRPVKRVMASGGDVVRFGSQSFRIVEITPTVSFVSERSDDDTSGIRLAAKRSIPKPSDAGLPQTIEAISDQRMGVLLDIAKRLSGPATTADDLIGDLASIAIDVFDADRTSLATIEEPSGDLVGRATRIRGDGSGQLRSIPKVIAERVVSERIAVLTADAAKDERFIESDSMEREGIRSAMCAPLPGSGGEVLGLLYVDRKRGLAGFNESDLDFLVGFAGIAGVALENSILNRRVRREAVRLANFQRYFAPDLALQISNEEGAVRVGGSRRPVVVLFADIRSFTSLSEQMSPEEIATLLTEYFSEMVEIIFEHGGTLDKFIGDALMALWGAPLANPDDADRALAAAVEMQRVLGELNDRWKRSGPDRVRIGVGLNGGEVFAGNIGSQRRLEYTVIGDAVNTAARLCSEAKGGEILFTSTIYDALDHPEGVEKLEPMALRGKANPVLVYRVRSADRRNR